MRALVQRVSRGSVTVAGEVVGGIGRGLVILVGVAREDTERDARLLADKVVQLRLFPEGEEEFQLSSVDIKGELLVVSQFTLLADTRKGRRPSFSAAAPAQQAEKLYEQFLAALRAWGLKVATGRFGEHMVVEIHNDGPVTLWLDSRE